MKLSSMGCCRSLIIYGRFPFDQIFRFDIPVFHATILWCDQWNCIFRFVGLTRPRSSGSKFRAKIRHQANVSFTFVYLLWGCNCWTTLKLKLGESDNRTFIVRILKESTTTLRVRYLFTFLTSSRVTFEWRASCSLERGTPKSLEWNCGKCLFHSLPLQIFPEFLVKWKRPTNQLYITITEKRSFRFQSREVTTTLLNSDKLKEIYFRCAQSSFACPRDLLVL